MMDRAYSLPRTAHHRRLIVLERTAVARPGAVEEAEDEGRIDTVLESGYLMGSLRDKGKRHDAFFKKAREGGYAARSVFKLEEIDQQFPAAAPGRAGAGSRLPARLLAEIRRRRSRGRTATVIGLDRAPLPDADPGGPGAGGRRVHHHRQELLGDLRAFDAVLSDMAPDTTGIRSADQARSAALVEEALGRAERLLAPGGVFVAKIFQGPDVAAIRKRMAARFGEVHLYKPEASRSGSTELYLVGKGFARAREASVGRPWSASSRRPSGRASASCRPSWPSRSPPARWSSGRPRWSRSWWRTPSTPGPARSRSRWRRAGGRLMRVADDGCGMTADEARLALQAARHVEAARGRRPVDAGHVRLPGRGAAVDRLGLAAVPVHQGRRAPWPASGWSWRAGARSRRARPGMPDGTQIEVRDLFFNTPARLKFLKTEATEAANVSEALLRLALANPGVHVKLRSNDRTVLDLPPVTAVRRAGAQRPGPARGRAPCTRRWARRTGSRCRPSWPARRGVQHRRATPSCSSAGGRCATARCWRRWPWPTASCWRRGATRWRRCSWRCRARSWT